MYFVVTGILCRTKVELSIDPVKNNSYTFSSPGFPEGYKTDLNCEWIIESEPQNHIEILFNKLDLESNRLCLSDYVALYKGISVIPFSFIEFHLLKCNPCRHMFIYYGFQFSTLI